MTVYVVVCCDPSDRGAECWTHGVYASKVTARRVWRRLTDDTTRTVRLDQKHVYESPIEKRKA